MLSQPGKYNAVCSMSPSFVFVYFFLPAIEYFLDVVIDLVASVLFIFIFGSGLCGYVGVRCLTVKVFGGDGGCG